jgi:pilus assembly protein CpaE
LSLPCLTNVKRLLRTFEKLGYPRNEQVRVIINRYHKKSLISLKDAEAALDRKISGLNDNDYPRPINVNRAKPLN